MTYIYTQLCVQWHPSLIMYIVNIDLNIYKYHPKRKCLWKILSHFRLNMLGRHTHTPACICVNNFHFICMNVCNLFLQNDNFNESIWYTPYVCTYTKRRFYFQALLHVITFNLLTCIVVSLWFSLHNQLSGANKWLSGYIHDFLDLFSPLSSSWWHSELKLTMYYAMST